MLINLKMAMAARQIRQVDFAQRLRIDPTLLSRIVNGRREADPSLRARIASELGCDETWAFSVVSSIPKAKPRVELNTSLTPAGA